MTAEVVIMNKSAVALAADSKVSIGSSRPEKTYDSQNKVFTLSKVHPVGIMVYNNADFMKYPWETIIKLYRQQKRDRSEPTIVEWGRDFIRFLRGFGDIKAAHKRSNVLEVLYATFDQIETDAAYYLEKNAISPQSTEYEELLIELLEDEISDLKQDGFLFNSRQCSQVLNAHGDEVLRAVARFVPSSKNKKLVDTAIEYGGRSLVSNFFSPASSGFVIAGFGNDEVFPAFVHYETDGYIGNQVKFSKPDTKSVSRTMEGSVRAFAQPDIVYRFMEGIAPEYSSYLQGLFQTEVLQAALISFERWVPKKQQTKARRTAVIRAAMKQIDSVLEQSWNYRRDEYWMPTVNMVSLLPKDELAHLAEALVELTATHRRVSTEIETVGGEIDVAVISKGDGFIWYRRKHYFDLNLNRHFELNYLRGIGSAAMGR